MNDETIELLEPYLELKTDNGTRLFEGNVAKMASAALAGLCIYIRGMSDYQKVAKVRNAKFGRPVYSQVRPAQ